MRKANTAAVDQKLNEAGEAMKTLCDSMVAMDDANRIATMEKVTETAGLIARLNHERNEIIRSTFFRGGK